MLGVLQGFATIGFVVLAGWLLAHLGILDDGAQVALSRLAFHVASPALLITVMQRTPLDAVLSPNLWTAALGAAGTMAAYLLVSRRVARGQSVGERVIGCLCSGYVNGGNLGLPIALYVLGDVAWAAPTLLLQLLVLTPLSLAVLDADARSERPRLVPSALRLVTNPMTVGAILGLTLAVLDLDLPTVLAAPVEILGAMAVPAMLIGFGIALRLGPRPATGEGAAQVWAIVGLKTLVQPALALAIGALGFGLTGRELLAVVVMGALPTAQNVFTFAVRYDRGRVFARDVILVSTFCSVPVIMVVSVLFQVLGGVG